MKQPYFSMPDQDLESTMMVQKKGTEFEMGDENFDFGTLSKRKLRQAKSKFMNRNKVIFAIITIILLFVFVQIGSSNVSVEQYPNQLDKPSWDPITPKPSKWLSSGKGIYSSNRDIPNIVHFVRQINRDEDHKPKAPFKLEFKHLITYYSAHFHLRPDRIYFWTDTPQEMLDDAKLNGDIFTKALFRIPNLEFRQVTFPTETVKGVPITAYAHKSDFIRTRVMAKMGGQYLDDDSWVIRDLKPLREAGFDNIFGIEMGDRIAQAAWLCKPMNPLMVAFARLQDIVFNGEWIKASNDLITYLMVHYSRLPGSHSSITLEKDAFFAGAWWGDELRSFYQVHDYDPTFVEPEDVRADQDIVETFKPDFNWGWRRDWRRTWLIHGWSTGLKIDNVNLTETFKEFKNFSPAYIASRRSNIARALYPAFRDMIDTGFLQLDPSELHAPVS